MSSVVGSNGPNIWREEKMSDSSTSFEGCAVWDVTCTSTSSTSNVMITSAGVDTSINVTDSGVNTIVVNNPIWTTGTLEYPTHHTGWMDPSEQLRLRNEAEEEEEKLREEYPVLKEAWEEYQLIKKLLEEQEIDKYMEKRYPGCREDDDISGSSDSEE